MDTTASEIQFDENGVCNFCHQYEERVKNEVHHDKAGQIALQSVIGKMKRKGKGCDYDCIIGVSGGVDSTYLAYLVKKVYGLRPLAVHFDNGWDSELAVANIEQTMKRLDIDLYTYVMDWEEFKDIQMSFLKASIANAEFPTDHAISAILVKTAAARKIPYLIMGGNIVTESIMPKSWLSNPLDFRLLKSIHRKFGKIKLKTFPKLSNFDYAYYLLLGGLKWVSLLNYNSFDVKEVKHILIDELGWKDYGGKHYESIYTRFFHAYYLPQKFGIDTRKPYLSALILSNQLTRDEALARIKEPPYSPNMMEEDLGYVAKKMGLNLEEFSKIMTAPPKDYNDYPNSSWLWKHFASVVDFARKRAIRME
jgi:N-acetyl sugar amidotransferase